jgi:hypothetical protein
MGRAQAHIGSPDDFLEGDAGPYHLMVTVRPPQVVPGVAEVEIRSSSPELRDLKVSPVPLNSAGAKLSPKPDTLVPSREDPQFYTGSIWLMSCCNWQVRVFADGVQGKGQMTVPVVAVASRTLQMQKTMAGVLLFFLAFLAVGAISITGAFAREAGLEPGERPSASDRRRGRVAMVAAGALVFTAIGLGKVWWDSDDSAFQRYIYKPLQMTASYDAGRLTRDVQSSGWLQAIDDLVPDHNHLMHLYVIHVPEMDRVWHLHPAIGKTGRFVHELPPMPAGRYQLFADVVHKTGLPETLTTEIDLPDVAGKPLSGDDSAGAGSALSPGGADRTVAELPDGYRMVWERPERPIKAGQAMSFRFRVEDPNGHPATDMEFYMGMLGHAAFLKSDRSTFAHLHPSGTVSMAALSLANQTLGLSVDPHAGHMMMHGGGIPATVSFPYAFPRPGNYRMFVQVKRGGTIETGVFDARSE